MSRVPDGFEFQRRDSSRHNDTGEIEQYEVYACEECGHEFSKASWETEDEWKVPMLNHDCG